VLAAAGGIYCSRGDPAEHICRSYGASAAQQHGGGCRCSHARTKHQHSIDTLARAVQQHSAVQQPNCNRRTAHRYGGSYGHAAKHADCCAKNHGHAKRCTKHKPCANSFAQHYADRIAERGT